MLCSISIRFHALLRNAIVLAQLINSFNTSYSLLPTPYSLLPTPYSLLPSMFTLELLASTHKRIQYHEP
ncbi:MAG: hypothetical protein F6K26_27410 [Moorea sp. SIO2I5]|nr:hypothetical protein [Moorena sp. SIO2I5]